MTDLTIAELKALHSLTITISVPGLATLPDKLAMMIAERAGSPTRGPVVFEIRIPLDDTRQTAKGPVTRHLAPTLNAYGSMKPWQRAILYKALDARIMAELHRWPLAIQRAVRLRRAAVVTRFSSRRPDEIGVDVLGGKVPIDRLVQAGILRGDSAKDLDREAHWQPAKPGQGSLLITVHDLV